jgi:hypothetical protein
MVLGISLPNGAKVEVQDDKVLIIFDEKSSARDLWKARFDLWLTLGGTKEEFIQNEVLNKSSRAVIISHRNSLSLR